MADPTKRAQSLDELLTQEYGVSTYQGPQTGVVAVPITAGRVIGANPNRVGLIFQNLGSNNIYLFTDNTVLATRGILCAGGGGVVSFVWRDDFMMPAQEWWGIASTAITNLMVYEVLTK